jgi:gamma-glutamyltranspeptidase
MLMGLIISLSMAIATAEEAKLVTGMNGMVTAAHPLAAEAGLEMLKLGGNAIDAMAATSFALGVVEPHASGLGGEGLMVIHLENPDRDVVIDGRSMATLDTSWDAAADSRHPAAAAVPGLVAAVLKAHSAYGTLPLKTILEPAIRLAREGFPVSATLASTLLDNYELLLAKPATAAIYMPEDFPASEGEIIKNPDLAWSLEQIAEYGVDALYKGVIADKIVEFMTAQGGYIGYDDLAAYEAIERVPARGTFRGYEVISGPPPVSGHNVIANLNMWEQFNPDVFSYDDPLYIHIMAEIMKKNSADTQTYMGDPDFSSVPTRGLTSDEYARERFTTLSLGQATVPSSNKAGDATAYDNVGMTFVQRVIQGADAFNPSIYTTEAFADPFVQSTPEGWKPIDGEWSIVNGKLVGSLGQIASTQSFAPDRMFEVTIQTLEQLGPNNYNIGRLYGKYVDSNNNIYVYLRTDGNIRFSVKADGVTSNYDAIVTVNPMEPHQYRLMFLGNKAELWIDGQLGISVEDSNIGAMGGKVGFWSQLSKASYDNVTVKVLDAQGVSGFVAAAAPAEPVYTLPTLDYKYRVLDENFAAGFGDFTVIDGEWSTSATGAKGTRGVMTLDKEFGVDRHVSITMKTLESLGSSAWNVGRATGKYEDDANRVYAYLRKDESVRLSVVKDGKNTDYNFSAAGFSPFDEHVYEYYFAGDTVQFVIDGKIIGEVKNEQIANIKGGVSFWMQDATAEVKSIVVEQTNEMPVESGSTTHVSIVDKYGNAVSLTQTISSFLGTGDVVPGTGFLLNNEMMNFGSAVNSLQPGKRMRTTIAPTILLDNGDVRLVVGSPGAARIITTVTEVIVNHIDFKMDIQSAIDAPKFFSRYSMANLEMEGRYSEETIAFLKSLGHNIKLYPDYDLYFGGVHAIAVDAETGELQGAADPRRDGAAAGY